MKNRYEEIKEEETRKQLFLKTTKLELKYKLYIKGFISKEEWYKALRGGNDYGNKRRE